MMKEIPAQQLASEILMRDTEALVDLMDAKNWPRPYIVAVLNGARDFYLSEMVDSTMNRIYDLKVKK